MFSRLSILIVAVLALSGGFALALLFKQGTLFPGSRYLSFELGQAGRATSPCFIIDYGDKNGDGRIDEQELMAEMKSLSGLSGINGTTQVALPLFQKNATFIPLVSDTLFAPQVLHDLLKNPGGATVIDGIMPLSPWAELVKSDTNNDSIISRTEFIEMQSRRFDIIDKNEDGVLKLKELDQALHAFYPSDTLHSPGENGDESSSQNIESGKSPDADVGSGSASECSDE